MPDLSIFLNDREIDLAEYDLSCLRFQPESIEPSHELATVEGVDGYVDIDTTYTGRQIHSVWWLQTESHTRFHEQKDNIYRLFAPKNELIIIDHRLPHKHWKVQTESSFIIDNEQGPTFKEFDIPLISKSTYAFSEEKIIATKDTAKTDYYFLSPTQITGVEQIENNRFTIFNPGEVLLDGRWHQIVVKFKGASDKLRIRNESTGSQWQYLKTTTASDELVLDQVYPYKNDINIFTDTDHGAITLLPGANDFRVYGASGDYEISFEFRPLYI